MVLISMVVASNIASCTHFVQLSLFFLAGMSVFTFLTTGCYVSTYVTNTGGNTCIGYLINPADMQSQFIFT